MDLRSRDTRGKKENLKLFVNVTDRSFQNKYFKFPYQFYRYPSIFPGGEKHNQNKHNTMTQQGLETGLGFSI